MKWFLIAFVFSLLVFGSCTDPTATSPAVETVRWEADSEEFLQFSTNDPQYYDHSFLAWRDPFLDPPGTIRAEVKKLSGYAWAAYGIVFCLLDIDNFYLLASARYTFELGDSRVDLGLSWFNPFGARFREMTGTRAADGSNYGGELIGTRAVLSARIRY